MNAHAHDAPAHLGATLQTVADGQLAVAGDRLGWQGGHRHKGVHHARKSIRRVRAVLALAAPSLGPEADALDGILSDINTSLSPVRDAQALVEAIDRLCGQTKNSKWLGLLARVRRRAVEARRDVMNAALAIDPNLAQVRRALAQVATGLARLPWSAVTREDVDAAFLLSAKRAAKAARKAARSEDIEAWHRWRRKARRQMQQQRILASAHDTHTPGHRDRDIAEHLGQQQDCSLLLAFSASDASPIPWADASQLEAFVQKKRARLRKALKKESSQS